MDSKEQLGKNIYRYRKAAGLTQKALAELLGVNRITINRYENGELAPRYEKLRQIAQILGVDLSITSILLQSRKNKRFYPSICEDSFTFNSSQNGVFRNS